MPGCGLPFTGLLEFCGGFDIVWLVVCGLVDYGGAGVAFECACWLVDGGVDCSKCCVGFGVLVYSLLRLVLVDGLAGFGFWFGGVLCSSC